MDCADRSTWRLSVVLRAVGYQTIRFKWNFLSELGLLYNAQMEYQMACLLFVGNFALGLGLQLRFFKLKYRILHHVLYFLVSLSCVWAWWATQKTVLLAAFILLLLMPKTRAGRWEHAALSIVVGVLYILAVY